MKIEYFGSTDDAPGEARTFIVQITEHRHSRLTSFVSKPQTIAQMRRRSWVEVFAQDVRTKRSVCARYYHQKKTLVLTD